MRITEDADRLQLHVRPNWLLVLMGLAMIVIGVLVAEFPGRTTVLSCDRTGKLDMCEIRDHHLFGSHQVTRFPMYLLKGATVEGLPFGRDRYFYRLNLTINDGRGPYFFSWYGREEAALAGANRVVAYVADPAAPKLSLNNERRQLFYPLAAMIAVFGFTMLGWGGKSLRTTFDRERNQVRQRRHGLFGAREWVHPLSEVVDFHVAGLRGDCQLSMELASGSRLRLTASSDMAAMGGPSRMRARHLALAERLRGFLAPQAPSVSS